MKIYRDSRRSDDKVTYKPLEDLVSTSVDPSNEAVFPQLAAALIKRASEKEGTKRALFEILRGLAVLETDEIQGQEKWKLVERLIGELQGQKVTISLDDREHIALKDLLSAPASSEKALREKEMELESARKELDKLHHQHKREKVCSSFPSFSSSPSSSFLLLSLYFSFQFLFLSQTFSPPG